MNFEHSDAKDRLWLSWDGSFPGLTQSDTSFEFVSGALGLSCEFTEKCQVSVFGEDMPECTLIAPRAGVTEAGVPKVLLIDDRQWARSGT